MYIRGLEQHFGDFSGLLLYIKELGLIPLYLATHLVPRGLLACLCL